MVTTLPSANLNELVYETLRRRILERSLGPGAKLSLHELAAELGVSRSPVHHALTRLVSDGLLSVKPRRGYYVTPVTARTVLEGYDVRLALELHAAEHTIGHLHPSQLARFRELMEATAAGISHDEWDAANEAFHEYQVDLAENTLLSRLYREVSMNVVMQAVRQGRRESHEHLAAEHRAIVDAFEAERLNQAKRAIKTHIASGKRIALEAIEAAGGSL